MAFICVHCRTGSLEKLLIRNQLASEVHCRTGSLEINSKSPIWL